MNITINTPHKINIVMLDNFMNILFLVLVLFPDLIYKPDGPSHNVREGMFPSRIYRNSHDYSNVHLIYF